MRTPSKFENIPISFPVKNLKQVQKDLSYHTSAAAEEMSSVTGSFRCKQSDLTSADMVADIRIVCFTEGKLCLSSAMSPENP